MRQHLNKIEIKINKYEGTKPFLLNTLCKFKIFKIDSIS